MKFTTATPYVSTLCEAANVAYMREVGDANGYLTPLAEHCGYTLIDGKLVPETFIQRVIGHISTSNFDYGVVLTKEDIFEADFLESLDAVEHSILMPVVLQLVARDDFPLNFWTELGADHLY